MARENPRSPARKPGEPTLTEQARRAQLIDVTVRLIAENGNAGTSLARIAEAAGITKAAVLYHFGSKDALVRAAHESALTGLVEHVGAAVESAGAERAPAAYVLSMVGYLRDHPGHTRVIVDAVADGEDRRSSERWRPLADLMHAARRAHGAGSETDAGLDLRTTALIVGGGIDAIVAEHLDHPGFDPLAAAEDLVAMLDRTLFP
ncbi:MULTISPECIES: TetR/AcrR family transcriptional regulator [Nocardiopsis]|uniref:TetR family transcriptional regulator n=1 Tax=Nocardiopsis sinuspersici TaxID=501010 RepID=A0A1V3C2J3_9ACTN|nr:MULTISPECIES: TetR/AcrR family transcriptional regulator [Nocardiopsis]OOC54852.1 TetR family transcriptional regulator [Nocardiopsis sinuspersici]